MDLFTKPRGGDAREVLSRGFILSFMNRIIILIVILILWGCASMQPPGGGPEDKESPTVIWSVPTMDSVRVPRKVDILVAFSEKMNHESVENAVYLSPFPAGEIKYSWKKNILKIELRDSLETDKTFVVTLGTDGKDSHGNPLLQAHSFAFSTGDSIDRGSISGRVVTENTKGISIWSYRLDETKNADSLIYTKRADYITQVGAGGQYQLSYLSPGKYRIFAIADLDADYRYSPSSDFIGLTFKDVVLKPSKLGSVDIDFMIFQEDTAAFRLESVAAVDPRLLVTFFSKPLHSLSYFENTATPEPLWPHFKMIDSLTGAEIPFREVYLNPSNLREVRIFCELINDPGRYKLFVNDLVSQNGERIVSDSLAFDIGSDTSHIKIEIELVKPTVKDGSILQNESLEFRFSAGIGRNSFERNFQMRDSTGQSVIGEFVWTNSAQVEFRPHKLLASQMDYKITIPPDSVHDAYGRAVGDTTVRYFLRSFKADSLGFVSGMVMDDDELKTGPYYITCRNLNRNLRDHSVWIETSGSFTLNHLIPGKYSVVAFRDDDRNGLFSYGRVSPITFSEKFTSYADTVTVRPNWETSNVILRFRK